MMVAAFKCLFPFFLSLPSLYLHVSHGRMGKAGRSSVQQEVAAALMALLASELRSITRLSSECPPFIVSTPELLFTRKWTERGLASPTIRADAVSRSLGSPFPCFCFGEA